MKTNNLIGKRKLILGIFYLVLSFILTILTLILKGDLKDLSFVLTSIGLGIFGIVYGNIKEHQFKK